MERKLVQKIEVELPDGRIEDGILSPHPRKAFLSNGLGGQA